MIKVLNIYKLDNIKLEDCIYIGRFNYKLNLNKSVLANPYSINKNNNREQVIEKYKIWLDELLLEGNNEVSKEFNRLVEIAKEQDIYLVCYCRPKDCHGDYIKELIEVRLNE